MRLRTGSRDRTTANAQSTDPGRSPAGRLLRHALVGLVIAGLAYAVSRYLDSIDRGPAAAVDRLEAGGVEDVLEDAATIRIGEPGDAEPDEDADETNGESGDAIDADRTNAAFADEERSAEEIEERAESDVEEAPAEPGEMTVDEEVADELVDEAPSETEAADERDGDERDEE